MRGYLFLAENQHKFEPNETQKLHFFNLLSQKTPQIATTKGGRSSGESSSDMPSSGSFEALETRTRD